MPVCAYRGACVNVCVFGGGGCIGICVKFVVFLEHWRQSVCLLWVIVEVCECLSAEGGMTEV